MEENVHQGYQFILDKRASKRYKIKKSLCYLQTPSLRVGTVHSVWRDIETVKQVKRCIVRTRILTGTYTLQAHRNVFNKTMDPTCPHCQLEAEDLRHMVCCCPAFHDDRVSSVELLKQMILQETSLCTWNSRFSDWEIILRIPVCPDFILNSIPELRQVISKIEKISRDYFYKIHIKRLRLKRKRK